MPKKYSAAIENAVIFAARKKRGVRVVEGARLESVYTGNCIEGSNPFLSAEYSRNNKMLRFFILDAV